MASRLKGAAANMVQLPDGAASDLCACADLLVRA